MYKNIFLLVISVFFSISFSAQMNKKSREKIKTLKIAYITEELDLTVDEAQKFWPIYNKYDEEQHSFRNKSKSEIRKLIKQKGDLNAITNKEAERLISLKLKNDENLLKSQKEFIYKVKKILPYKKILKLQIAEMEFGRKLMRKYKKRK